MAHETPTITAHTRDRLGTRYARRLRSAGRLPAVIYGHQQDPVSVSVDEKETLIHLRRGAHLLNVKIEGGPTETCLVKDVQFGYLGDNVVHLDFTRVDLEEEVEVAVHLHFVGQPEEAKKPGAVLNTHMTELEVICKAGEIPSEIKVDLSKMVGETLTVADLVLPPGVRAAESPESFVVHITFVAEEEAVGEQAEVAGAAEPEVITEKKAEPAAEE